jgi:predicted nucleic acid-binding protein
MYAWGGEHLLRAPCAEVLQLVESNGPHFITDAEVLQEILHRYKSLQMWPAMAERLEIFVDLMQGSIEPVFAGDVVGAAKLAHRYPTLSARDLVHAAVALRAGATHIVSADTAFDALEEIERLDPMFLDSWRTEVLGN